MWCSRSVCISITQEVTCAVCGRRWRDGDSDVVESSASLSAGNKKQYSSLCIFHFLFLSFPLALFLSTSVWWGNSSDSLVALCVISVASGWLSFPSERLLNLNRETNQTTEYRWQEIGPFSFTHYANRTVSVLWRLRLTKLCQCIHVFVLIDMLPQKHILPNQFSLNWSFNSRFKRLYCLSQGDRKCSLIRGSKIEEHWIIIWCNVYQQYIWGVTQWIYVFTLFTKFCFWIIWRAEWAEHYPALSAPVE